ncbi:EAL domain-containing protein [Amphritea sp. HPY]|uniref:EAL domain-containing protein n=1 Tax=Amphritea sp. HPY TaxID=3421652 RepID=UPI003D7EB86B
MNRSLAFRFGYMITLVATVMAAILLIATLFFVTHFYDNSLLNAERQIRYTISTQLAKDTEILADTLAIQLATPLQHKDHSSITKTLQIMKRQDGLEYLYVYNRLGNIVYADKHDDAIINAPVKQVLPLGIRLNPNIKLTQQDNKIHVNVPIIGEKGRIGGLIYSISFTETEKQIQHQSAALAQQAADMLNRMILGLIGGFFALLLLILPASQLLAKRLLKPLGALTERSRGFKVDGEPVSFRLPRNDEIGELGDALQDMQEHLYDSHEQMALMAYRDPLTSLPNRRGLYQELRKLILWAKQQDVKLALLFIDLDHFKQINDSSSHEYGDLILKEIAQRLLKLIRLQVKQQDLPFPEDLLLSRLGGDEFVAILPDVKWIDEAEEFGLKILESLQQPFAVNDKYFSLSCSIGITIFPDDATSTENMLKHADIAMFEAKRTGRNRVRFFMPEMHRLVEERILIQQGISTAIAEDQLFMEYQPIFDLQTEQLIGAEALLRWRHPERGKLEPETFIPVIEESDQIGPLTLWSIDRVCNNLSGICQNLDQFKLTINISSAILDRPEITQQISDILRQKNVPNHFICLEITETSLMQNLDSTLPLLQEWKNAGFSIWIDDFGTGYSSLSYLARLPIDGVKIDRSFIHDANSRPVVEAILALSQTMNLMSVSEGIEERSQLEELRRLGCHFGQGYLLSGPVGVNELRRMLKQPEPEIH